MHGPINHFELPTSSRDLRFLQHKLQKGDLLLARVTESLGKGRYQVSVSGKNVTAKSNLNLAKGAVVRLRVKAVSPKIELQLIEPNKEDGKSAASAGQPVAVSAAEQKTQVDGFIKQHSLSGSKLHRSITSHLIQSGLGLDKAIFDEIMQDLVSLHQMGLLEASTDGSSSSQLGKMIDTLIFMRFNNIPLSKSIFSAVFPLLNKKKLDLNKLGQVKDPELRRMLRQVAYRAAPGEQSGAQALADALNAMGFDLESCLLDDTPMLSSLKALLLKLLPGAKGDDQSTIDQMLAQLRKVQLLNLQPDLVYFELPVVMGEPDPVTILVNIFYRGHKEKRDSRDLKKVLLSVELSALGRVGGELVFDHPAAANITFRVENPQGREVMEAMAPSLMARLKAGKLPFGTIRVLGFPAASAPPPSAPTEASPALGLDFMV